MDLPSEGLLLSRRASASAAPFIDCQRRRLCKLSTVFAFPFADSTVGADAQWNATRVEALCLSTAAMADG
jgi:hypothetical protein